MKLKEAFVEGRFDTCVCRLVRDGKVVKKWVAHNLVYVDFYHRYPDWMSLSLHLALEKMVKKVPAFLRERNVAVGCFYHFVFGLICGYSLREIFRFIRGELAAE